jgi:hypothetical protein
MKQVMRRTVAMHCPRTAGGEASQLVGSQKLGKSGVPAQRGLAQPGAANSMPKLLIIGEIGYLPFGREQAVL